MYQQITLVGNLGRDPEMRYTASGVAVTSFPVATSQRWTGADGQRNEKTIWFRVSAWQRQAETCNQYLTKGQRVLVVGEIELTTARIEPKSEAGKASISTSADVLNSNGALNFEGTLTIALIPCPGTTMLMVSDGLILSPIV